jgi:hypothetical protein
MVTSLYSLNGVIGVLHTASGAGYNARTQSSMISGSIKGSSPWMFTTTWNFSPSLVKACSHRSVPFGISESVITTSAPAAMHAFRMRSSSVATTSRVGVFACFACSYGNDTIVARSVDDTTMVAHSSDVLQFINNDVPRFSPKKYLNYFDIEIRDHKGHLFPRSAIPDFVMVLSGVYLI